MRRWTAEYLVSESENDLPRVHLGRSCLTSVWYTVPGFRSPNLWIWIRFPPRDGKARAPEPLCGAYLCLITELSHCPCHVHKLKVISSLCVGDHSRPRKRAARNERSILCQKIVMIVPKVVSQLTLYSGVDPSILVICKRLPCFVPSATSANRYTVSSRTHDFSGATSKREVLPHPIPP